MNKEWSVTLDNGIILHDGDYVKINHIGFEKRSWQGTVRPADIECDYVWCIEEIGGAATYKGKNALGFDTDFSAIFMDYEIKVTKRGVNATFTNKTKIKESSNQLTNSQFKRLETLFGRIEKRVNATFTNKTVTTFVKPDCKKILVDTPDLEFTVTVTAKRKEKT